MTQRRAIPVAMVIASSALAACGADLVGGLTGSSITGYESSSAFSPAGHSVTDLGDGRVRVTATGSAATPKARVEKIALARAAEYGAESGHKFFRAELPQHSIKCGRKETSERGKIVKLPVRGYSVVDVDVTYSKDPADPTFKPTKDTAEALKAEIAAEAAVSDAQAKAAVDAQCGA